MKSRVSQTRSELIPQIFIAILELKKTGGSSLNEISQCVRESLQEIINCDPKNVDKLVRNGLKHGIKMGVFKKDKRGKYAIAQTRSQKRCASLKQWPRAHTTQSLRGRPKKSFQRSTTSRQINTNLHKRIPKKRLVKKQRMPVNRPESLVLNRFPEHGAWEPMDTEIQSYLSSTVPSLTIYTSGNQTKCHPKGDSPIKSTTSLRSQSTGSLVDAAPNGDNKEKYGSYNNIQKQEFESRENDSLSHFKRRSRNKSLSSIRTSPLQGGNVEEVRSGNGCPSECDTEVNSRMETSDDESSNGVIHNIHHKISKIPKSIWQWCTER